MANETLLKDLEYASTLAKAGDNAPLVGGPIGLMWGILLTLTFFMQWAILSGQINIGTQYIGFLWLAFAVIGGIGLFVLSQKASAKPGANSAANRVETYVWTMFAGMMFTLFIGVVLNMLLSNGSYQLFDLILIVGFAGQGLAYGVVAKMSKIKTLHTASFVGFTASALCFSFYGDVTIYLIGSIACLFTIVAPSISLMKKAEG